jgi:hypothetical protein
MKCRIMKCTGYLFRFIRISQIETNWSNPHNSGGSAVLGTLAGRGTMRPEVPIEDLQ